MLTLSPAKQRIKQREETILLAALHLIEEHGFGALTMEQLARQAKCTKGTLYNHFINKEDLLCELGTRYSEKQMTYYRRIEGDSLNSRERVLGLFLAYQIFAFLNRSLFSCVLQIQSNAQLQRASPTRLATYREAEMQLVMCIVSAIQYGIDQGDIPKKHKTNILQLAFTGWATTFGNIALMLSSQGAFLTQQADREAQLFNATQFMLDGLQWRPLSIEKEYQKSWKEIGALYFKSELKILHEL